MVCCCQDGSVPTQTWDDERGDNINMDYKKISMEICNLAYEANDRDCRTLSNDLYAIARLFNRVIEAQKDKYSIKGNIK